MRRMIVFSGLCAIGIAIALVGCANGNLLAVCESTTFDELMPRPVRCIQSEDQTVPVERLQNVKVVKGPVPDASNQFWVVAGDYNSRSPVDARRYDLPLDSPRYAVHRWLAESTPLVDALHEWLPNDFHVTCGASLRLDYVYLTRCLYDQVTEIRVVVDRYTRPTYAGVGDIWRPSDHRPILVDFDF